MEYSESYPRAARNLPLLLAVFATNSDFTFSLFFNQNYPFLSTNWLILPIVATYLLLSGRIRPDVFISKNVEILVFFVLCLVSQAFYSIVNTGTTSASQHSGPVLQIATSFITYFLFHELIETRQNVKQFLSYVALSTAFNALLLAAIAMGFLSSGATESWVGDQEVSRFGLGDPNITFCYLCVGCAYWVTLVSRNLGQAKRRLLLALISAAAALMPAVVGLSRGAFLSAALCLLASLFLISWAFRLGTALKFSILAVVLLGAGITFLGSHRLDLFMTRWEQVETTSGSNNSASIRIESAKWLISDIVSFPNFYGKGYLSFSRDTGFLSYSHFTYADIYIYGGIIALLSFFIFMLKGVFRSLAHVKIQPDLLYRAERVALLVYCCSLLFMFLTVSVLWMKLVWAAFAVLARANALDADQPQDSNTDLIITFND